MVLLHIRWFFFLGVVLCPLASALFYEEFSAEVLIFDIPGTIGAMSGTIHYDYPNKMYRIDYEDINVIEIFDFTSQTRFMQCNGSGCQAETVTDLLPEFFVETSIDIAADPRCCGSIPLVVSSNHPDPGTPYQKHSQSMDYVWVDSSLKPLWAMFPTGKKMVFLNLRALDSQVTIDQFNEWNCPGKQCSIPMDLYLVLDESGSIEPEDWDIMKDWAEELTRAHDISQDMVHVGIITYSDFSRTILNLDHRRSNVENAISHMKQWEGWTCTGCGINTAIEGFARYSRRPNVLQIVILLTDGINNRPEVGHSPFLSRAIEDSAAAGILTFAIGVGSEVNTSQVTLIASDLPIQTVFHVSEGFSGLSGILDELTISVCVDDQPNRCGTTCRGFCGCNQTCLCPNLCNDFSPCTQDYCDTTLGHVCVNEENCDDNDACTEDTCDSTGCQHNDIVCDGDPCKIYACDEDYGCYQERDKCVPGLCENATCDSAGTCSFSTLPSCVCEVQTCQDDACNQYTCNPETGACEPTPICPNKTLCVITQCDNGNCVDTGVCEDQDPCTEDQCSIEHGSAVCSYVPTCNDNNKCTDDTCNSQTGDCTFTDKGLCTHLSDPCQISQCEMAYNESGGYEATCVGSIVDCDQMPGMQTGSCAFSECTEETGCQIRKIEGAEIDKCGNCVGDGETCALEYIEEGALIGGGILALIIILVIIAVLICLAVGGKTAYELAIRHQGDMSVAQDNPMFEESQTAGDSPLYTS